MIYAAIAIVILVFVYIAIYNNLRSLNIKVEEAASGIEVALTKRYDVLVKLLDITKGYAKHEKEVLTETVRLRKGMSGSEMKEADKNINEGFRGISVVGEAYPTLLSNENFKQLQLAAADTEEHLQAARRLYNSNVTAFNTSIVTFPSNIVASLMKLQQKEFFEAEEAKKQDVKMEF